MQFLSYLKELTPLCEHNPEMIYQARIRLEWSKLNPGFTQPTRLALAWFYSPYNL